MPSLATFAWLTVFGNSALFVELFDAGGIAAAVQENTATAIYALLAHLPWSQLSSVLAVVVVASFFVTSSDSGSYVVDMLTCGGHADPPVWQRIFWALSEGAIAATLLYAGGLEGLKAAAICTGLPFCAVLLAVCVAFVRGIRQDPALAARSDIPPGPR